MAGRQKKRKGSKNRSKKSKQRKRYHYEFVDEIKTKFDSKDKEQVEEQIVSRDCADVESNLFQGRMPIERLLGKIGDYKESELYFQWMKRKELEAEGEDQSGEEDEESEYEEIHVKEGEKMPEIKERQNQSEEDVEEESDEEEDESEIESEMEGHLLRSESLCDFFSPRYGIETNEDFLKCINALDTKKETQDKTWKSPDEKLEMRETSVFPVSADRKAVWKKILKECDRWSMNTMQYFDDATAHEILGVPTFSYHDVIHTARKTGEDSAIENIYCSHVVQHVLRARHLVLKGSSESVDADEERRDQGFTRPRVLILTPFRNSAKRIVEKLIDLAPELQSKHVFHSKRFEEEYGDPTDPCDADEAKRFASKPESYRALFDGNVDDCFKISLSFSKKAIKLYSDFYASDILIASPLGLRLVLGAPGDKERDYDFLSSIEMVIVDQADVMCMQNIDHLKLVLECLNNLPVVPRDTDYSRIREWNLDQKAKYFRQSLLFSSVTLPELNALATKYFVNFQGMCQLRARPEGALSQVFTSVRQIFRRFPAASALEAVEERFRLFTEVIYPSIKQANPEGHILLYIPSYFDFVRLRNFFRQKDESFCNCSEYTKKRDIARSRSLFYHGKRTFLLCTERFYFFRRYRLRGIESIIYYGVPTYPEFYSEFLNSLESQSHTQTTQFSSVALFSKYDYLCLERTIGTKRATRLLRSSKDTHVFC